MGLDLHALNFIRFAAMQRPLGRVATLGRQELHVPKETLRKMFADRWREAVSDRYCEALLTSIFSATAVDSFDNSDFEGATIIHDFNKPIEINDSWDTLIDLGTLEHIYNIPQALLNISKICQIGGQILHVLPTNNQCGHGFYQFSPEFFFSLYKEENGYRDTRVFVANSLEERFWYEVARPRNGERANIVSGSPLYVMARTVRAGDPDHNTVQQSDYVYAWDKASTESVLHHSSKSRRDTIQRIKGKIARYMPALAYRKLRLNARNPNLAKIRVNNLLNDRHHTQTMLL